MRKKEAPVSPSPDIQTVSLYETARQRYLNYALSVITTRALPDVRDGMKPVQRRILYGMDEMKLSHEAKYQKCAQIVGQVMGRYHPHGDSSIYDALVHLSQPFAMRYPFVDGQGNFGSIDGDSAAAMRYTEARLQPIAAQMLEDLDEHIVEFRPNYSGTLKEPSVLPAAIPALLVNGSNGIAVGMATNIPPHNLTECVKACLAMIKKRNITLDEILELMPGPDFPLGGRILSTREEIKKVYENGQGPIVVQGEYHLEEEGKRKRIIITSLPFVSGSKNRRGLVTTIDELITTNKLPLLADVIDESAADTRIVLEPKPGADTNAIMAYLFKNTILQRRFDVNMTCIIPGDMPGTYHPRRLGLLAMIRHFIDFRFEVVTKRLRWQLTQLRERLHVLEGFLKLYDHLNDVIELIKNAEDKADASQKLCATYDLDEIQAEAILQLRLYRIAKLEVDKIQAEYDAKTKEARHIEGILASDAKVWGVVSDELKHVISGLDDPRRSQFGGVQLDDAYTPEAYIIEEDFYVVITRSGMFKRQKTLTDVANIRVKENDAVSFVLKGSTRAPLMLFSSKGRVYTTLLGNVPATTGHGTPMATMFKFEDGETIVAAYLADEATLSHHQVKTESKQASLFGLVEAAEEPLSIVAATQAAQLIRLPIEPYTKVSTASGRLYARLNEGDTIIAVTLARGSGFISLLGSNTRANVFPLEDLDILKSAGKGYRGISLDPGTQLVGFSVVYRPEDGVLAKLSDGREIVISSKRFLDGKRGAKGLLILRRGSVREVLAPTEPTDQASPPSDSPTPSDKN